MAACSFCHGIGQIEIDERSGMALCARCDGTGEIPDRQMTYYKGMRHGMTSYRDAKFTYKVGLNVHPDPDKSSTLCSAGIHLAKSPEWLKKNHMDGEIWECKAGVIYAEDDQKIRVGYCWLLQPYKEPVPDPIFPKNCLIDIEWLKAHWNDHPQDEIDSLGMEIVTGRNVTTIKAKIKQKDLRVVVPAVMKAAVV